MTEHELQKRVCSHIYELRDDIAVAAQRAVAEISSVQPSKIAWGSNDFVDIYCDISQIPKRLDVGIGLTINADLRWGHDELIPENGMVVPWDLWDTMPAVISGRDIRRIALIHCFKELSRIIIKIMDSYSTSVPVIGHADYLPPLFDLRTCTEIAL